MQIDAIYRVLLYLQTLHLQAGPFHHFVMCLKLLRVSADLGSFGKQFQIWVTMALSFLEPKDNSVFDVSNTPPLVRIAGTKFETIL